MTDITIGDAAKFGMMFDKDTITVLKGKEFLEYWCGLKEKAEKWDKLNAENIITADGEDVFPILDYVEHLHSKFEDIRKGLPNLSGIDKAILYTEYILTCLNLTKAQIKTLKGDY